MIGPYRRVQPIRLPIGSRAIPASQECLPFWPRAQLTRPTPLPTQVKHSDE